MDFSSPLEALVAPDKARVLNVLYRAGLPLSGRTIAALTNSVSQPTVSRMLRELVRTGLVLRGPGGYVINREHLAYRAVEVLLDSIGELGRRVGAAVEAWDVQPVSVVLFGSTARGQAGPTSDVDLLVVRPSSVDIEDSGWAHDVADLGGMVQSWTGVPCEVLEYDPAELEHLARSGDPLIDELLCDGVTFAGAHLSDILQTVIR
jgi:predicted nucleotidyltransferase